MLRKKHDCAIVQGDINDWTLSEPPTINTIAREAQAYKVDAFVSCAGEYTTKLLHEMSDAEIAGMLNTNLVNTILLLKRIMRTMLSRRKGTIVVVNSLAGKYASANEAVYSASKFGLRGFVEAVRSDYAKANVRILSVYPGAMRTPMAYHRNDWTKLLDPVNVAKLIVDLCLKQKAMRLDDIEIRRTTY
jgi:short-subunit dehydrogenase